MEALIIALAAKYPIVIGIFTIIGVLRAVNKPLFSVIRTVVSATATKTDDEALDAVERSRAYKAVVYVLDWCASVKLAPAPTPAPVVTPTTEPVKENV